jgi:nucleoside triphosphate pyrophosphatase
MIAAAMALVLASASPRRRELLAAAGVAFEVESADVDESPLEGETPAACVERLALLKARTLLARHPSHIVLGADTTVVLDGRMLAKPADDVEAAEMLNALSGRIHEVLTGVAIVTSAAERSMVETTLVSMVAMTREEIAWYIASGEQRDKAGAYAIQGRASRFIPRIEGSYSNVVGLPVAAVLQLMKEMGLEDALWLPVRMRSAADMS